MVRSIHQQPSAVEVHSQHWKVAEQLQGRFPQAAVMLEEAGADILAFTSSRWSTGRRSGQITRRRG